ncbi:TldD/PmbA family protein [Gemmatimonas groenlandica]|uniref:TldD/PmbA family protein n=1 Tax=Gemmatimonas groenlandica TaxID=2732249 RepID=A0A6M4IQ64_9BACT|nr:TldD/PmbA family protein [Gemmatimonas groenlandica]QJR36843.1 TldD/PmbA family protein [Gemmatimonas groenlandica]
MRERASANDAMLTREQAMAIVEKAVKMSKADAVDVQVNTYTQGNIRFADNQVSTAGATTDAQLGIQSAFGPKHAVVTTNDLSDEAIKRAVEQSERLARLAPDDPESMPQLGSQQYTPVNSYFESSASLTADDRAKAALIALEMARKAGDVKAAGYLVNTAGALAIGNSTGMFAYHRSTNVNYTLTARTSDGTGSGWAAADHADWAQIDARRVAETAVQKARLSQKPVALEPGRYTVILEPQAVGDLVQLIANYADARSADEGRSPFVKQGGGNKVGEKIVDERVTIFSDPSDPQLLGRPWDFEGMPLGRQVWIENGVLKQLIYSRFWAKKQSKTPTGGPSTFKMAGGTQSVEDLIKGTTRGILVTRLWYLREVDPRTVLYTGLTRDGTFLVENGKITKSLRNFRFNESPLFLLNNIEALGRPERLAGTEQGGDVVMPSIKARDFNFTSLSEAV